MYSRFGYFIIAIVILFQFANTALFANNSNADWMGNSRNKLMSRQLNQVILPGSHDAGSYIFNKMSPLASDIINDDTWRPILNNPLVRHLLLPEINKIILAWSKTQQLSFKQQLALGIRYFDLRICKDKSDLYFCHGMLGDNIKLLTAEINDFLDSHPKEIVILDFQHFYNMERADHKYLLTLIKDTFNEKLVTRQESINVNTTTLEKLWASRKQVVVFYSDVDLINESYSANIQHAYGLPYDKFYKYPYVWPRKSFLSSRWPNVNYPEQLSASFTDRIIPDYLNDPARNEKLFVAQSILSANNKFIVCSDSILRNFDWLVLGDHRCTRELYPYSIKDLAGRLHVPNNKSQSAFDLLLAHLQEDDWVGKPFSIIMLDYLDNKNHVNKIINLNWQ